MQVNPRPSGPLVAVADVLLRCDAWGDERAHGLDAADPALGIAAVDRRHASPGAGGNYRRRGAPALPDTPGTELLVRRGDYRRSRPAALRRDARRGPPE